jgi:hypothetical protein
MIKRDASSRLDQLPYYENHSATEVSLSPSPKNTSPSPRGMSTPNKELSPFVPSQKLNVKTFGSKADFVYGNDTGTGTDISPERF